MSYRYRITQSFEVSVENEPLFIEWAEQVVEPAESERARITSALMRLAGRALNDIPGIRLHGSHTNVHRVQPNDDSGQIDLRMP